MLADTVHGGFQVPPVRDGETLICPCMRARGVGGADFGSGLGALRGNPETRLHGRPSRFRGRAAKASLFNRLQVFKWCRKGGRGVAAAGVRAGQFATSETKSPAAVGAFVACSSATGGAQPGASLRSAGSFVGRHAASCGWRACSFSSARRTSCKPASILPAMSSRPAGELPRARSSSSALNAASSRRPRTSLLPFKL